MTQHMDTNGGDDSGYLSCKRHEEKQTTYPVVGIYTSHGAFFLVSDILSAQQDNMTLLPKAMEALLAKSAKLRDVQGKVEGTADGRPSNFQYSPIFVKLDVWAEMGTKLSIG